MPRKVKARAGDTLCGIAIRSGFPNCDPLRQVKENEPFKKRPLVAGDVVVVPDKKKKKEKAPTGKSTKLVAKSGVEPCLRFVHGSKTIHYRQDKTTKELEISNFVTDKAGATMGAAFPSAFEFHKAGHDDPDAFKLELVASDAGASPKLLLEALKPVYKADGTIEKHEQFPAGAERDARKLDVEVKLAGTHKTVYRSRYLRLVTDDVDKAKVPDQALLVTDTADGANGEADKVEILDQRVRASFPVPACKAPDPDRCTLRAELGLSAAKRRVRICVHVFRKSPGGAAVDGVTEKMIRRRVQKWFRRVYAQAGLAPRLVAPFVEFVDPPAANLVAIGQDNGLSAAGTDSSGNPSTITFRLSAPPPAAPGAADPTVTVTLAAGLSPSAAGAAIVGALPAGFTGVAFTNARGLSDPDASCDVVVTKDDGTRVLIRGEATTDTRLTIEVARVDLTKVAHQSDFAHLIPATSDFRSLIRSTPGKDDQLDYYIIEQYKDPNLRGRAFVPAGNLRAPFRPPAPLRWAIVMACKSSSGKVADDSDNLPFTLPHEGGHVLSDAFHTAGANAATEMMRGADNGGTSVTNAVDGSKRICDSVHVQYEMYNVAQHHPGDHANVAISAVQRMRTRGAPVMEDW